MMTKLEVHALAEIKFHLHYATIALMHAEGLSATDDNLLKAARNNLESASKDLLVLSPEPYTVD
jgi:hypothetical protein